MRAFARYAWAVVGYHLAVVAWGAFVRVTGSGAGCGRSWPTCNGEVIPRSPEVRTAIEFVHRVTSAIAVGLVAVLVVWAVRSFPRGHAARRAAWSAGAFLVAEALIGAALVLFGWVAGDVSAARGWAVAIHLANTFLLLASLALAATFAEAEPRPLSISGRGPLAAILLLALAAAVMAGATGAIAALGDTLYPALSFAEGLERETSTGASVLLRLRVLHPFAALGSAIASLAFARVALRSRPEPRVRTWTVAVVALVAVEVSAGVLNLALLAPAWLQILHLLLADVTWLALVLLSAATLATAPARPLGVVAGR